MDNSGKSALGLDPNVAAGLAYLPVCGVNLIMSIIIIATDKTNKLARFHAFQSILLMVSTIPLIIVYAIGFGIALAIDSAMGFPLFTILVWLIMVVLGIGLLVFMVIALIKAFQGQIYKIPVIGNMADNWSN